MENVELTIVSLDDWEAVYAPEGYCLYQGHSISAGNLFSMLQHIETHPRNITLVYKMYDSGSVEEYGHNYGELPQNLHEILKLEENGRLEK